MKRTKRSVLASILAILLAPRLVMASAIPWVIDRQGDLLITRSGERYVVTQADPQTETAHQIRVADGVETKIVLRNVALRNDARSSIDLGASKATRTVQQLEGSNRIRQEGIGSGAQIASISIQAGSLRILGNGSLTVLQEVHNNQAAALGGEGGEAMSAEIQLAGDVQVKLKNLTSTAIGAGAKQKMQGQITMAERAQLEAESIRNGAAVGAAYSGRMQGSILVKDEARLIAKTKYFGAAIGSGAVARMEGSVRIQDRAYVEASSPRGAAIGSGGREGFYGDIDIRDQAVVLCQSVTGVAIGAGGMEGEVMNGTITVRDQAKLVSKNAVSGAALGTKNPGRMEGTIRLLGHARLDLHRIQSRDSQVIVGNSTIGAGPFSSEDPKGHYEISPTVTINGIKAENAQVLVDKKLVNIHMKDGKPQNYTLHEEAPPSPPTPAAPKTLVQLPTLVGLRTLRAGRVRVGPVGPKTTGLLEEASSAFTSLEGQALYHGTLRFEGEDPAQAFVLSFHLGSEYAGKTVQVQQHYQGQQTKREETVSEAGLVSLVLRELGDFAILLRP